MDLFIPEVPEEKYHYNFKAVLKDKNPSVRAIINEWAKGFVDRDGKLRKEFQTTFNSVFWELYLFACLKQLKYVVDFSNPAPDFMVTSEQQDFCIEAAIANNPNGMQAEWEKDYSNLPDVDKILELATIRLSNTLVSKYDKYVREYSKLPHVVGKPFIIAIAPFEQPFFFFQNLQAIRRVLYGYDIPYYEDIPNENRRIVHGHKYMSVIQKPNGSGIPLGYFTSGKMKEVSAVLFSNTATFSKVRALCKDTKKQSVIFDVLRFDHYNLNASHELREKRHYRESLLDGLNILFNPTATVPLDKALFNDMDIIKNDYDLIENQMMTETRNGALIQRTSSVTNLRNY